MGNACGKLAYGCHLFLLDHLGLHILKVFLCQLMFRETLLELPHLCLKLVEQHLVVAAQKLHLLVKGPPLCHRYPLLCQHRLYCAFQNRGFYRFYQIPAGTDPHSKLLIPGICVIP